MRRRVLQLLAFEHGALLCLPAVLVAAALVLFALRQAASEGALFNHARELRVAVGPARVAETARGAAEAFESGLVRGLRAQRELVLVEPARVRARLEAVLGGEPPEDARTWMRSTRSLNVLYCLAPVLEADARGWNARLDVWDVAREERVHTLRARAAEAGTLGRALADSVSSALFRPSAGARAAR